MLAIDRRASATASLFALAAGIHWLGSHNGLDAVICGIAWASGLLCLWHVFAAIAEGA